MKEIVDLPFSTSSNSMATRNEWCDPCDQHTHTQTQSKKEGRREKKELPLIMKEVTQAAYSRKNFGFCLFHILRMIWLIQRQLQFYLIANERPQMVHFDGSIWNNQKHINKILKETGSILAISAGYVIRHCAPVSSTFSLNTRSYYTNNAHRQREREFYCMHRIIVMMCVEISKSCCIIGRYDNRDTDGYHLFFYCHLFVCIELLNAFDAWAR